eukprot:1748253-Pleurochrysis_carterae.AAC.4
MQQLLANRQGARNKCCSFFYSWYAWSLRGLVRIWQVVSKQAVSVTKAKPQEDNVNTSTHPSRLVQIAASYCAKRLTMRTPIADSIRWCEKS